MTKKSLLTMLALASVSSFAWAGSGSGSIMFQNLDANHDGQVSRDEVKNTPEVSNNFSTADVNKDGKLDAAEFSALEVPKDAAPGDSTLNTPGSTSGSMPGSTTPNTGAPGSSLSDSNAPKY